MPIVNRIAELADGNPRTASILYDLAWGETKTATAHRHGISGPRVSHILTAVRERCSR